MEYKELWDAFYKENKYIMWFPGESTIKFFGRISKEMDLRGKEVLDFGCGVGRNSFFMTEIGLTVYGIDISENAIEHAKYKKIDKKNLSTHFKVYNGSNIPFKDNEFDFVISHGVLDHVLMDKAKELMKEIHRVIKPNGLMQLDIHSIYDSNYGKREEIERNTFILEGDFENGLPQHYFSGDELEELTHGFKIKQIILSEETFLNDLNKTSMYVLYLEAIK